MWVRWEEKKEENRKLVRCRTFRLGEQLTLRVALLRLLMRTGTLNVRERAYHALPQTRTITVRAFGE